MMEDISSYILLGRLWKLDRKKEEGKEDGGRRHLLFQLQSSTTINALKKEL